MAPRHLTLPKAQTAAAKLARQTFYCQLCTKGYTRMNEYEAHLGSYDHQHKQRLKDMKAMVRDPTAAERSRRQEAKERGMVTIKLSNEEDEKKKKGGFKKGGFKSAFTPKDGSAPKPVKVMGSSVVEKTDADEKRELPKESDTEVEGYERYNPRFPTD